MIQTTESETWCATMEETILPSSAVLLFDVRRSLLGLSLSGRGNNPVKSCILLLDSSVVLVAVVVALFGFVVVSSSSSLIRTTPAVRAAMLVVVLGVVALMMSTSIVYMNLFAATPVPVRSIYS